MRDRAEVYADAFYSIIVTEEGVEGRVGGDEPAKAAAASEANAARSTVETKAEPRSKTPRGAKKKSKKG